MAATPPLAVDWQGGVSDAWTTIATFVPKLVFFGVVLVVGYFLAKILARVVNGVLERVGFDNAVERGGIKQALARSKYDASDIVAKLVKYTVMLFTLVIAFNVFGPNPISTLLQQVIAYIPRIIVAIIIIVVASAIAKVVKDLIANTLGGLSYGNVLATIASVFIMFLGIVAALNEVGVATAVTTPVLITILATIGGVIVVGAGGGLIRPMQSRWESWLNTAERETQNVKAQIQQSPGMRQQAGQLQERYQDQYEGASASPSAAPPNSSHPLDLTDPSEQTRRI
jgi:Mechanosensitive ion channel, conserved TM helix